MNTSNKEALSLIMTSYRNSPTAFICDVAENESGRWIRVRLGAAGNKSTDITKELAGANGCDFDEDLGMYLDSWFDPASVIGGKFEALGLTKVAVAPDELV